MIQLQFFEAGEGGRTPINKSGLDTQPKLCLTFYKKHFAFFEDTVRKIKVTFFIG
jgi:hypothetical protein